ncbi:hypothetical protein SAMN04487761_12115 [Lachnospiraceae bacterium C7]|nr:hypothetical protein SAMN04487761_12115 [Lachnospiraceae bacterium C7]
MSLMLGPIHTWLFRKIKLQNELVDNIIAKSIELKYIEDDFKDMIDRRYGVLEDGDLADICDSSNIHGWLQSRITLVENRLAFTVTFITDGNEDRITDITGVAYDFGKRYPKEKLEKVDDAYKFLGDVLVNGMPCDRVNSVVSSDDNSILWEQTVDIHGPYWECISGNMEFYEAIKEALIIGLLEETDFTFEKVNDNLYELRRK